MLKGGYFCYNLSWTDRQKPKNFLFPIKKENAKKPIPIKVSPYMDLLNNHVGKRILALLYKNLIEEEEFYKIIVEEEKLISKEVLKDLMKKTVSGGVFYKYWTGYGGTAFFTNTKDGDRLHKFFNNQLKEVR